MMSSSTDDSFTLDGDRLSPDTVLLTPVELEQAVALSAAVRPADQWPAYLNALALMGFHQWLAERGIELPMEEPSCSVNQPLLAGLLTAVCSLSINGFDLCLIPTGSLTDDRIAVPRATLELPSLVPHLLIGLDIQEEQGRVRVWGWLRQDQLQSRITELQTQAHWTYAVPRAWFDENTDSILLYLTCLESQSITRLALAPRPLLPPDSLADLLSTLTPRLRTSLKPIWKLLTWEQISGILMHPELRRSLTSLLIPDSQERNDLPILASVIQVRHWLQHQLDPIAQSWSWSLFSPLPSLRGQEISDSPSTIEQFEQVVATLTHQGIVIPSHACGAYRDLGWNGVAIRLYVVTWDLSLTSQLSEWALLLLLGAQPNYELPPGISLTVRDYSRVLDEQTLTTPRPDAYLFSQVIGEWHEQFWVSIDLTNGVTITLPPFTFGETQP